MKAKGLFRLITLCGSIYAGWMIFSIGEHLLALSALLLLSSVPVYLMLSRRPRKNRKAYGN